MQKLYKIKVDISKKHAMPAFEVNTNDLKSIRLSIEVLNGSSPLDLSDKTVRIAIRKPDNNIVFQDCEIADAESGQVEVTLENQAYITPGAHTAEIMCYKGSDVVAVSGTFSYKSTKGIMNDEAVESKSEFTAITLAINEAKQLLEDAIENGGGGGAGIDEQARQEIQEVSEALAGKVNEVTKSGSTLIFKADGKSVASYDLSSLANSQAVQSYVDALVTNGSIAAATVGKSSVTPEKLSFMKLGKNKASKNYLEKMSVSAADFRITTSENNNNALFVGYLEPGETYTVTKFEGGNRFRIATTREIPNRTNLPMFPLYTFNGADAAAKQTHTFTNTANANYVVVFTNTTDPNIPKVQVEKGEVSTAYEFLEWDMNGEELKKPEKVTDYFTTGKNKFDGKFTTGISIDAVPKVLKSTVPTVKSAVVPLERGKTYTIKKYAGGDRLRIAIVDKYPTDNVLPLTPLHGFLVDNNGAEYTTTITNNYGDAKVNYLIIYTNNAASDTPLIQVEEGSTATSYEEFNLKYMGKALSLNSGNQNGNKPSADKYYLLDSIAGIYDAPDLPAVSAGSQFVLRNAKHTDIYAIFDRLMETNPSYISRTLLGNDAKDKSPIYQYHFKPVSPTGDLSLKRPKLIIISGVHGTEKMSPWGLTQFIKDMCENWKTKPVLEFMRWNFEFVVIPICNPWGFDRSIRTNGNNIDINRNFPTTKFVPNYEYGGTAPNSEIETQLIVNTINAHSNAHTFIDYHTWITDGTKDLSWQQSRSQENKLLYMNVISTLSRKWKKEYPQLPQDDKPLGYVATTDTSTGTLYAHEKGISSMTIESTEMVGYGGNTKEHDALNVAFSVDLVGNVVAAIGKNL